MNIQQLSQIAKLLRYYILTSSSKAGSGHPTSSLSSADIMAVLYFNFLNYDFANPQNRYNDRLIFSKGHASPLLYSLYKVAGLITEEELMTVRTLYSPLQGHPTPETPYVDVATGSLGMGLSFGLGMALANKIDNIKNKTYVLLGDGEMAEGNIWEAIELASHYKLNNLIGIIDVNRLAETGETMLGHNIDIYQKRVSAFGWETALIDGHNFDEITNALTKVQDQQAPCMIIAKTIKGKGVSFLENQLNRHGKALKEDELNKALSELNINDSEKELTFAVNKPSQFLQIDTNSKENNQVDLSSVLSQLSNSNEPIPTRKAYGMALTELLKQSPGVNALDGDLSDSTFSGLAEKERPEQFFNMFIAEQNMVASGTGMSKMGKTIFASTFAAFFTRAYDQIRMSAISNSNIKIVGSHAGVSIGEDGVSQMGLEDIAMMRPILNSTILYPSDGISTVKLVKQMSKLSGISYLRTTRKPTPIIYRPDEEFPIGKFKTLKESDNDCCLIIAAGITLHEALSAYEKLKMENIHIRIIDLYSIKPIDVEGLKFAASKCNNKVITVEDHYFEGGLGDAVLNVFANSPVTITKMAIAQKPHSGKPDELLENYGISAQHIIDNVHKILSA